MHHAIAATKNLVQRAEDQDLSIACIQELYQIKDRLVGIPAQFKFFYLTREKLKAGIVVFNNNIQAMEIEKQDGTKSSSTQEAIEELLNFHFPEDQGQDSPSQFRIRQASRIPPLSPEDPPFSAPEVNAAFHNLKSKKAPGPDGLYGDDVKEAYASNPHYFRDLFNICLSKGHFPGRWKRAQVVMLNKKNKQDQDPSAYRPICLLEALGKVLDKLITQRVFFHLLSNNLLHTNQFGFMPGRSAPDAIL
ncbi:Retrovirus-related Pol polyprotein from type-1 retrotransposable element R1 [Araneus ventricosus]|uniref:Retrovirus-related Pol polyprotein from type-1 retrotransposable element R1 n=1 Tax=Araneus ventricosus TaxID=182803 RepID=A0A4Y2VME7_ARAVE|nr:Retrovirus-related Pol polyprotein from type-1 retrotransposable element R1 [Araneus ventricosus]